MLAGQGKKYHRLILSTFGKPSTFDATIEEKKVKLNGMNHSDNRRNSLNWSKAERTFILLL